MTLTFAATDASGSPRVFAGMHRRPFSEVAPGNMYVRCVCGTVLQNFWTAHEHWQQGHLDVAVYHETPPAVAPREEDNQ